MSPESGEPEFWKPRKPYGYGGGEEAEAEIARLRAQLVAAREALAEAERENFKLATSIGEIETARLMAEKALAEAERRAKDTQDGAVLGEGWLRAVIGDLTERLEKTHEYSEADANRGPEMGCFTCYVIQAGQQARMGSMDEDFPLFDVQNKLTRTETQRDATLAALREALVHLHNAANAIPQAHLVYKEIQHFIATHDAVLTPTETAGEQPR